MRDIIEVALARLTPVGIHMDVFDAPFPDERSILYHHTAGPELLDEKAHADSSDLRRAELVFTVRVEVGGRTWSVQCSSEAGYVSARRQSAIWWILASGLLITGGLTFYIVLSARRAEQRRRMQEGTEWIAQELRQFIEMANAPIFGINSEGKINEWNNTSAEIAGFSKDEVIGRDLVEEFITEEYRAPVKEVLDNALDGQETANYQFPLYTKDKKRLMVLLNASTRLDVDGKIVGVLGVGQDITELDAYRKNLEQQVDDRTSEMHSALKIAETANRGKSEFLASMSHELRTPLNAIIGFSQVLEERYFGELTEKQAEHLANILDSGKHLLTLINDILDLSKVEAGKMELEVADVDVSRLIFESLMFVQEKAHQHSIRLETSLSEDASRLTIQADERKLKQVLFNLLSNATKFTPDGGSITLSAELADAELLVRVQDTGIGLKPEDLHRVFDEFEQIDSSYAKRQQGTGLGLALTKRLVEMHGGRTWAESEGEGKGSTFTFALPLQDGDRKEDS